MLFVSIVLEIKIEGSDKHTFWTEREYQFSWNLRLYFSTSGTNLMKQKVWH